jgi:signal transduction histidine kinase
VRADGQRLLQVFINLLSNARAASEPGGEIRVDCVVHDHEALVTVTDDGCGIPAAQIDQVFEPFFTTKAPGEGTGLGLALVYSIVRDMDGSVAIQSPDGPRLGTRHPRAHLPAARDDNGRRTR